MERAIAGGLAATVAAALPAAERLAPSALRPAPAGADGLSYDEATLQAFADTIVPGRRIAVTELGNPVDPRAIAAADPLPGAVETDALALYHHPLVGFDALAPAFLADLERRAAQQGKPFLELDFAGRTTVAAQGLDFANPQRVVWEAAAAIPFIAFCAAALVEEQTAAKAAGYRVMGLPGRAPGGYPDASYRRRLARERTTTGNLG